MALCADARLDNGSLIGDPTEALIVLAEKGGISVDASRDMYPRVAEVPFDLDYKFMATFHAMKNEQGKPVVRCFVKGAPDVLIAAAARTGCQAGRCCRSPMRTAPWHYRKTTAWHRRVNG